MVVVAQLVRASVCGTEGRGFESRLPPKSKSFSEKRSFFCGIRFHKKKPNKIDLLGFLNFLFIELSLVCCNSSFTIGYFPSG